MRIPKAIQNLIEAFERLPGIGPKTAQRLTFYLLAVPQEELDRLSLAVTNLKKETRLCSVCFNVDDQSPCRICQDTERNHSLLCVVGSPLDVLALEKTGYKGLYHVLHGLISPLSNIGPDDLYLQPLLPRVRQGEVKELILAMSPSMEGEATAMYIKKLMENLGISITRIGRGLPVGSDLEYADERTLEQALSGRRDY
ncbi:MAG: recombination mediator RecR [bacterium]|nr:recombination mediator RecR [bacterium]